MPTIIEETEFFSQSEVADLLSVDRTTLWRWRKQGKIPAGRRFRGGQVLYTRDEIGKIHDYANRMEPIKPDADPRQTRLFEDGGHYA